MELEDVQIYSVRKGSLAKSTGVAGVMSTIYLKMEGKLFFFISNKFFKCPSLYIKPLTLLTWVTTASTTSPLNGRKTMALYFTGQRTNPLPGWITPAPMLSMVVTAITKPYLEGETQTDDWCDQCDPHRFLSGGRVWVCARPSDYSCCLIMCWE